MPVYVSTCQQAILVPRRGKRRREEAKRIATYRHDLAALAQRARARADVHHRAVERAARALNQPDDEKDARLRRDPLQLLPRAISPLNALLRIIITAVATELPLDPRVASAAAAVAGGVAEVDGGLKVARVLFAAGVAAVADDAAKVRAARVPANVGLGEQQQVDALRGGAAGEERELLERGGLGGLRAGGGGSEADGSVCHWSCKTALFRALRKLAIGEGKVWVTQPAVVGGFKK